MYKENCNTKNESTEDKVPLETPAYIPDISELDPSERFRWIDGPPPQNDTMHFM